MKASSRRIQHRPLLPLGWSILAVVVACTATPAPPPAQPAAQTTEPSPATTQGLTTPPLAPPSADGVAGASSEASSTPAATAQIGGAASSAPAPSSSAAPAPEEPPCPSTMAFVPGGSFQRAGTKRPKELPDLCVDVLETSAAEYSACVDAGGCTADGLSCSAQATFGKPDKQNHPITCVTFEQAEKYCAHHSKRLPTVDEWEWVARGGEAGRKYPWGEESPDAQLCWTGKSKQTETCPVGSFEGGESLHGIKDMAGNVLEFASTSWDASSPTRIVRGGAWKEGDPYLFRTARLGGVGVDYRCGFLGIRCVSAVENDATPDAEDTAPAAAN